MWIVSSVIVTRQIWENAVNVIIRKFSDFSVQCIYVQKIPFHEA